MKRILIPGAVLAIAMTATLAWPAAADPIDDVDNIPDGTSAAKVLLFDIDGVRWDKLQQADTPTFDALAAEGQLGPSYIHGPPVAETVSAPGRSNTLTGVWPDKHGVVDNSMDGNDIENYPDLLTRLEGVNPDLSTFSITDWQNFSDTVIGTPDVKMVQTDDGDVPDQSRRTAAAIVKAMTERNPDAGYVYFHDPDAAGHTHGSDSPEYIAAIEQADSLVGEIVQAVRERPTYGEEDWLFLVGTDHGQVGSGHGGNDHREREVWTLASGGDIPATGEATRQWQQVDMAPTIFAHLGESVDPAWGLDGVPIGTESEDPFDTLAGDLQGVVDEEPKPDNLLGWTKSTPDGWQIEDQTPDVGVTEYRGWTFQTGQFWATAHADQGRETFFRGRDVIAVADPDEWDDKGNPTQEGHRMDSTLLSPSFDVEPGAEVQISYMSQYQQVDRDIDPQRAQLVVRYDTGDEQELWSRNSTTGDRLEISVSESFTTTAPDGATSARVGWRMYDAANNFYWAIDTPRIEIDPTQN